MGPLRQRKAAARTQSGLVRLASHLAGMSATIGVLVSAWCGPAGAFDGVAVRPLLNIDFKRLPDGPAQGPPKGGFQDSDGGWVSNTTVVTAFGYTGGGLPGFLNSAWVMDVTDALPSWQALPVAPVSGLQALCSMDRCTLIDERHGSLFVHLFDLCLGVLHGN